MAASRHEPIPDEPMMQVHMTGAGRSQGLGAVGPYLRRPAAAGGTLHRRLRQRRQHAGKGETKALPEPHHRPRRRRL